ncbi:MAG: cation-transporting P-type ATPase [Nitriliruptoraceae bacterium]|nr:cation-transporting P-type ATPase [Nitriliruptoraceae bacterium]
MSPSTTEPSPSTDRAPSAVELPWARPASEVVASLRIDLDVGLASSELAARRASAGANVLPTPARTSLLARVVAQLRSWLVAVLLVAAGLAVVVGEPLDAVVITVVLLINVTMGLVQEHRAERSVDALEQLLVTRARVLRDGRSVDVDAAELVVGDVVSLTAGDRIPADGRLLETIGAEVDESSLTGESTPVAKDADADVAAEAPVADRTTMGWMNTALVRGRARLVVTAVGARTQVGAVAELISTATPRPTPLQRQLDTLGRRLVAVAGIAVALVFALALARGEPLADAALDAIALAVAAIPEGLPAVVTLTLALGASAMARRRAIVRRLTSVETLGATDVICTDKTGTLTRNVMTVTRLWRADRLHNLDGEGELDPDTVRALHGEGATTRLVGAMVRCNDADITDRRVVGNPTEGALLAFALRAGADVASLRAAGRLAELPFDAATKLMAVVHRDDSAALVIEVKGAPDVLLERCSRWVGPDGEVALDPATRERITGVVDGLGAQGLRTLAIARRVVSPAAEADIALPVDDVAALVEDLTLEAIVGIVDPPRPGVADAIATAQRAGIRVVMVTGDHPRTAASIAAELGITGEVVTGAELDRLDEAALSERIARMGVIARVAPEHKVRIVRALQSSGQVVAMTGDGVNDAPALEHADIGIAMGITGTEVTKQAADLVLADDDFATIVTAVERGRTIYDNIVAFIRFQLATNLGAIAVILVARLVGLPVPFTPIQLLWVNIIMDGPPALALGVDRARTDTMRRPPRDPASQLLDPRRLARVALAGAVMAAGTLGVYLAARSTGLGAEVATSWTFTTFVLFQVANALNARSETATVFARHTLTNRSLWVALTAVVGLQIVAVHVGPVGRLLDTAPLSAGQWATSAAIASTVIAAEELRKAVARRALARQVAS